MLEEKIKKSLFGKISNAVRRNAGVYLLAGGLAVLNGCEEEPKPSEECCNEKKCTYNQVCDGDGDDCYCTAKTEPKPTGCMNGICCMSGMCGYESSTDEVK